jgi:hypothetical protein
MVYARLAELRHDVGGLPGPLLDARPTRTRAREIQGMAAQDHDALAAVGPLAEREHRLVRLPPDHDRVDAGDELVVAVGLGVRGQPVEIAVQARDEAVNARADEHRYGHTRLLAADLGDGLPVRADRSPRSSLRF